MKLKGEMRINAPRATVFAALNDPEVLKQAIPGCQDLEKTSDTEFTATVVAKVGPIKATFKGTVTLHDLNPPESYAITGQGQGGTAGFAKGGAKIQLTEDGATTVMSYEVNADVGGKLAQLGGRLIEGTSKRLAGQFFESFKEIVGETPAEEEIAAARQAEAAAAEPKSALHPLIGAVCCGLIAAAVIYFLVTGT